MELEHIYIPEGEVVEVASDEASYLCVMRLQCADGEIQLFATSYNDQLFDSLQVLAKSYISEKVVCQSVREIIRAVENPPNIDKFNVATQTQKETHVDVDMTVNANHTLDNVELDEDIDVIDEAYLAFLHDAWESDGNIDISKLYGDSDIQPKDLMRFVCDVYSDDNKNNDDNSHNAKFSECPYKCGLCEKTYTRHSYLVSHIAVFHNGASEVAKLFKCSYCDKPFDHKASLKKHFVTHISNKPFRCTGHCEKTFGSKQQLERHVLIYRGIRAHKCSICGKTWATKAGLKGHKVVHSSDRSYQCDDCGKTFARKSQLTRHALLHENDRKHICTHCGKTFLRTHDLTRHSALHETNRRRPYPCSLCEKTFTKKSHLARHKATHYAGLSGH